MSSFKYYDDNNLVKNISFGETILKTVLLDSNPSNIENNQKLIQAPDGTNRLTIMGEADGDYFLTVQQYLGSFNAKGGITLLSDAALNIGAYLPVYDTLSNVYTKSLITYMTRISSGTGLGHVETDKYSADHSLVLYYNMRFTKPYISIPLVSMYNDAYFLSTSIDTIAIDFFKISGKAVELLFTQEPGRTALYTG